MKERSELEFFNIGGVFQLVAEELEPFIREHERLHRVYQERYKDDTDYERTARGTQTEV